MIPKFTSETGRLPLELVDGYHPQHAPVPIIYVKKVFIQHYHSPCGELVLASTDHTLCLCDWNGMPCAGRNLRRIARHLEADLCTESSMIIEEAVRQLDEYFAGCRREFSMPLQPVGTDFQLRVWRALLDIPCGQTRSYMDIARAIGSPRSARAAAQAIGANGIAILIPCHRVIGSNQSLTGFAGGLDKKAWLLDHEQQHFQKCMI